jgi:hypothetical protein
MLPGPSSRTRKIAARQGHVVPIAWDDIDRDPAPARQEHQGNARAKAIEDYDWLVASGESRDHAAARVGMSLAYLEERRIQDARPIWLTEHKEQR